MSSYPTTEFFARIAFVCALVLSLASNTARADTTRHPSATRTWSRPSILVPTCSTPPHIDGVLDDACWKNAAHAEEFFRLTSPVTQQTEAWICADTTHLYIAFHCIDSHPQSIKASETQRNGNTYVDDFVEVDLDSQNDHRSYSQFIVTARGTQNEYLEGGTADNITWAGDWRAATRRTADGWTAEISIPFALLRYPPGARAFGIMLQRKLARENTAEFWPERPPISRIHPVEYFGELTGISPQLYRPQPLFLPYVLASVGDGNSVKEGLDVKYPLTSGITGLATFNPDFSTVEQSVTSIAFSYTQQYIDDERPFFDEGSDFFPSSDIFYSSSIGNIDEGIKAAGKQGQTSVGLLATEESGPNTQFARTLRIQQDLNPLSFVTFDYAGDNQTGLDSNQVAHIGGLWRQHEGRGLFQFQTDQTSSWVGNEQQGGEVYDRIGYRGAPGHPSFFVSYNGVAPNFVSDIGYVPQTNFKGPSYFVRQSNTFDRGPLQSYNLSANWTTQDYWTGGFFQDSASASASAQSRAGNYVGTNISQGRHIDYRDHLNEVYGGWSQNSQFGGGGVDYVAGTQEDQHYEYWNLYQSYGFSQRFNASVNYSWEKLGSTFTTQAILTPQYRLTSERTIGGRILNQNGQTDVFLLYAQKVRSGSDIFILFGNPNSASTEGQVQVKVETPF